MVVAGAKMAEHQTKLGQPLTEDLVVELYQVSPVLPEQQSKANVYIYVDLNINLPFLELHNLYLVRISTVDIG